MVDNKAIACFDAAEHLTAKQAAIS